MNTVSMDEKRRRLFYELFGTQPQEEAFAAARVNLLGEHTDYNRGLVLPTQLPQRLYALVAFDENCVAGLLRAASCNYGAACRQSGVSPVLTRALGENKQNHWTDYVLGALMQAEARMPRPLPAVNVLIDSSIPMGAGLSSSAALEVAVLRAVRTLVQRMYGLSLCDDYQLARMAQRAENDYVDMPCGLMDQLVVSLGTEGSALCIDFADDAKVEYRNARLFSQDEAVFSVHYSGISHALASGGGYEQRRDECERAALALRKESLRACSIDELNQCGELDDLLFRRARHVITENERVQTAVSALERGDVAIFGACMNESHASQRDDFEVSLAHIDAMVHAACANGAYGARLTGGGFGGSIVVLSAVEDLERISTAVNKCVPTAQCLAVLQASA